MKPQARRGNADGEIDLTPRASAERLRRPTGIRRLSPSVMTTAEDRYRTLLDASSALADQPTVKAVLHSLRGVLASTSRLHGAELYVLSDDGQSLYTFEFDRDVDAPAIKIGTKALRVGAAARVLDEQKPVFVPDLSQEMLNH